MALDLGARKRHFWSHYLYICDLFTKTSSGQTQGKALKTNNGRFFSQILLNGRDLRDYQPQWLRENISFVTSVKDTYLFSATVRENIEFGIGSGLDPGMEVRKQQPFLLFVFCVPCCPKTKAVILPRQARDRQWKS